MSAVWVASAEPAWVLRRACLNMRKATQAKTSEKATVSGAFGITRARFTPSGASSMPVTPISAAAR